MIITADFKNIYNGKDENLMRERIMLGRLKGNQM